MNEMSDYCAQLDRVSFSPDFERTAAQRMRQTAEERNQASMKNKRTIRIIIAAAAAAALLTTTVFAVRAFLTPAEVAGRVGQEEIAEAFSTQDAIALDQTAVVGDYTITLHGMTSGQRLDFMGTLPVESDRSYVVLSVVRNDGAPIAPEDDLVISGSENALQFSPLVEGWEPWIVNAWSLGCAGHGTTADGVRYYLFDYASLEMFADRTVYMAVYEGFAPSADIFSMNEAGGISFDEGYAGAGALFSLPVDPSRADPEAAYQLLSDLGFFAPEEQVEEQPEVTAPQQTTTAPDANSPEATPTTATVPQ